MATFPRPFRVGDKVRIKQRKDKLGPTLWEITELLPPTGCMMREAGTNYASQQFDTSLLKKVDE